IAPGGLKVSRLIVLGVGKPNEMQPLDALRLGGKAFGKVPRSAPEATVVADLPAGPMKAEQAADLALGAQLRAYSFERYKTKRKEGEEKPALAKITVAVGDLAAARKAWASRTAVEQGTTIARDLVN